MAQALALPLGYSFSQAHYFGPPEAFAKQELQQELFPAFKADYDDGLDFDAAFPALGGDIGAWDGGVLDPCFLHDNQLDATTPMASLSDDSDDCLLPNSSSTSSLDSSSTRAGALTVAAVPTVAAVVPTAARSCRAGAGPRPAVPCSFALSGDSSGAHLTREERVQRYREKRKRRTFEKTIRYEARRAYAEVRPRIKGRFATKAEVAAMKAAQAAGVPIDC